MIGGEEVAVRVEAEVLPVNEGVGSGVIHVDGVPLSAQVVIGDIVCGVCSGPCAGH